MAPQYQPVRFTQDPDPSDFSQALSDAIRTAIQMFGIGVWVEFRCGPIIVKVDRTSRASDIAAVFYALLNAGGYWIIDPDAKSHQRSSDLAMADQIGRHLIGLTEIDAEAVNRLWEALPGDVRVALQAGQVGELASRRTAEAEVRRPCPYDSGAGMACTHEDGAGHDGAHVFPHK